MPDREETLGAGTTDRVQSHARATQQDAWDQRKPKEIVFKEKVQAAAPKSSIKNLDPIVDALRVIKSPAEVAVIRESTRIASLGILEAMKSAKPGMYEYELEAVADYLFKRHNAQGIAYFALVATGTNAAWPHYHAAQSKLEDGDLVLMDYAPDLPLLRERRHADVPGERQVLAAPARAVRHLREALQGPARLDRARARRPSG